MTKTIAIAAFILTCSAAFADGETHPEWMGKEPLIFTGNWDSMPIFRRRAGGATLDMERNYERQHTEEAVSKLKDLGVTMAIIHFYKGFGLEAEKAHREDARKLADLLHRYGIRVGVYVGSTIAFETFLVEKPEAEAWLAPEFFGRPVFYSNQTFRRRVYFMLPGYREYMKRVLRIALEDLHADLIHFDNTSMQAEAPIFHHPAAVQDFRSYLARKLTPEQRTERFGFPEVQRMEAPAFDRALGAIDDPLFQEWADFRCEQLTAYYAEMERFIRSLNPQAAVESNPHSGISGRNTVWEQGVDYARLLPHMDAVWTEEGNEAGVTSDGVLVSKIRSYKLAELFGNRIFTYTGGGHGGKLQMAESMAFNRQTLGQIGDGLAGYSFPSDQRRYLDFFRRNFELFRDVHSRPDIAVLHSYASMAYNNDLPWQSAMLVEQSLIEAKVPFEIIFDAQLKDLSKYRAVILPDQESLSEPQMDLIREYVRSGGGLVSTEATSMFDEWRRRRTNFGLRDVFGIDAPANRENLYTAVPAASGAASRREHEPNAAVRRSFGKGRSSYVRFVEPAKPKPTGAPMVSAYWKRPLNYEQMVNEIRWAANGFSISVSGPASLVAEPLRQDGTGRLLVHLLNYDVERHPLLENIRISLTLPAAKEVRQVRLMSPDTASSPVLQHAVSGGSVEFTVPRVGTYAIAAIDLQ